MVSNKQASTCAKICHVHRLRYEQEGIGFYLRHALVNVKKHLLSPTPDHDLFLKSLDHNSPFDSCHLPSQIAAPLSTSLHAFDLSLILPIELWCWIGSFRALMTNSLSHSRRALAFTSRFLVLLLWYACTPDGLIRTGSHRCERRPSLGRCKFLLSFVFCFLSGVVG